VREARRVEVVVEVGKRRVEESGKGGRVERDECCVRVCAVSCLCVVVFVLCRVCAVSNLCVVVFVRVFVLCRVCACVCAVSCWVG
jgi:hypothetical protein